MSPGTELRCKMKCPKKGESISENPDIQVQLCTFDNAGITTKEDTVREPRQACKSLFVGRGGSASGLGARFQLSNFGMKFVAMAGQEIGRVGGTLQGSGIQTL